MQAFNNLCAKADELEISIFGKLQYIIHQGNEYHLEDLEDEKGWHNVVHSFPPTTEIKLTYEKRESETL